MNRYIFSIGSFQVEWYSVLILIGVMVAITMILREARRFSFDTDFVFNMCFWTIIFGIIGARIYYVIFNLDLYTSPLDVFKIWEGGLAIHGGIIAGLITIIVYCRIYKVRTIRMLDFIAPALFIAQAIGRWGNFFNSEAHGAATTLAHLTELHIPEFIIKGMCIDGVYYEPTFLYESLACLVGALIILIVRRLKATHVGTPTALYLIIYGAVRFVIEGMRTDSLMLGSIKMAQLVSIVMFVSGLVILLLSIRNGRFEDLYNEDNHDVIRF